MSSEIAIHDLSTSTIHHEQLPVNGVKRPFMMIEEVHYEDPSIVSLPSNDHNSWYYPSHSKDVDNQLPAVMGNWGRKTYQDSRWARRGKMIAWGPNMEEWEAEERARKRLKLLLPPSKDSSDPIVLPHLRSPSPPLTAPYPAPSTQHLSYTSFVMDKAITHSFRSRLLDELEHATNSLIQGEAAMRRALGRLWQAMSEDPDVNPADASVIPKREDEELDEDERRAPDLTPIVHKIFLSSSPSRTAPAFDPMQFTHPDIQLENLEKSLATLRELQDDGREYVERLEEIREGLGDTRTQRDGVWDLVRRKAIKELQDVAAASAF